MLFTVATSGSIATLAVAFPIYLAGFVPLTATTSKVVSLAAIAVLTWINILGVKNGARVQNVLTVLKVAGLVAMVIVIFLLPAPAHAAPSASVPPLPAGPATAAGVGAALVAVLWAYEGWHDVSFAAGEIHNPQRNFPLGLVGGVALCLALYIAANLAYLKVLTPAEIAATDRVALTAMNRITGAWGGKLLTAAILASILGALNAMMLSGPRAYYQMAKDGMFFDRAARVHPKWRTPVEAILFQALWASFLILIIGGFSQLFTYVIFGGWIFYGLAVLSVVVLRRKDPGMARPFRVPGYPFVPLLFGAAALALVVSTLMGTPRESGFGLAFIGLGIPIYYLQRAYRRRRA
jgi:APA family basic amino acid/polyamine antiporter